jgi:hypothetical protein
MFETIAGWYVVITFALGVWLIVEALWTMAD